MKEFLLRVYDFFAGHDFPSLLDSIRGMEWRDILKSLYTWLIGGPLLLILLWKKQFKIIVALGSLVLFLLLLQRTLPPADQQIPLNDLLMFLGGSFVLVAANIYFIFIRD